MPKVGARHFDYSPAGIKAAKMYASMTGHQLVTTKKKTKQSKKK